MSIAVLVASYGKNSNLWPLVHYYFSLLWPDCPYLVYLGANGSTPAHTAPQGWRMVNKGADAGWSSSMLDYLSAVDAEVILLVLDDFLLWDRPVTRIIEEGAELIKDGAVYAHLRTPAYGGRMVSPHYRKLPYHVPYRASLKPALWKKEFLADMLAFGLDPWRFEKTIGGLPMNRRRRFLSCTEWVFPAEHCVRKGCFTYILKEVSEKHGLPAGWKPDREVLERKAYEAMYPRCVSFKTRIFNMAPPQLRYLYRLATGFFDLPERAE